MTITEELVMGLTGENPHYGAPVNSAAQDRVTGGSSSGSASAVAAGVVDFALGSVTGGSVRATAHRTRLFQPTSARSGREARDERTRTRVRPRHRRGQGTFQSGVRSRGHIGRTECRPWRPRSQGAGDRSPRCWGAGGAGCLGCDRQPGRDGVGRPRHDGDCSAVPVCRPPFQRYRVTPWLCDPP